MTAEKKRSKERHSTSLQDKVLSHNLCSGCGACVGVCPTGAVSIDSAIGHTPVLDEDKCTDCGLCYDVCPGRGYPVVEWSARSCDDKTAMVHERGPVRHYWLGHSTDPEICAGASSGGIATSLLLYLLDSGQVDDVAVVVMEKERPTVRLTHDPKVVLSAMMSKYGPVPSMATIIPELSRRPRRVAMTVTPCQLGAWMRATEKIPKLRNSEILSIGLFCGQIQTYDALTAIAATLGVHYPGEAKLVAWRYGDYPGSIRFEKPDGVAVEKPLYPWLDVAVPFFSLKRCNLCPDCGNWMADMTLGDNHRGLTDETLIVCRTERGEKALEEAKRNGAIDYTPLDSDRIKDDPVLQGLTRHKLLPAIARNTWLKRRREAAPEFDYDEQALLSGRVGKLRQVWIWKYQLTIWACGGWRFRFLSKHPWLMEKVGHFLYYFPGTVPGYTLGIRMAKVAMRMLGRHDR